MESVLAIGVGLGLRVVVDVATDDHKLGGVLVGLWEGVILNHFIRKMPRSFDPYIALGFRVFVDFLFTQSLSRMALVALWTLVGMLLADIAPSIWRGSGLRRLYRRMRREVRHIKRAVPDIRIKNDIPTVRLFSRTRTQSTVVSIRSDRATPAQSPAPGTTPMPAPPRRPGRSPPGTFPGSSGWSETEVEVATVRERVVMSPGPSPALIPTRMDAQLQYVDTSNLSTPQARLQPLPTAGVQTETMLLEAVHAVTSGPTTSGHINDRSHHDPPSIPDDWVDITPPLRPQPDISTVPSFPEPQGPAQVLPAIPLHLTPSRPPSVIEAIPRASAIPDIPDIHIPYQIPLPSSRAATVIGGVEEQPSSVWRSTVVTRMEKASSELGVDPLHPIAPYPSVHQSDNPSWLWPSSKDNVPTVPSKPKSENAVSVVGALTDIPEAGPLTSTPTQVDPPTDPTALNTPTDGQPPPPPKSEVAVPSAITATMLTEDGNADASPPQVGDNLYPSGLSRNTTYLDPDPSHDPPPPFSDAVGGEDTGNTKANGDPVTQDEQPTELTEEQRIAEKKRQVFLLKELTRQQTQRDRLQEDLDKMDHNSKRAQQVKSKLNGIANSLDRLKERISKKCFSSETVPFPAVLPLISTQMHRTVVPLLSKLKPRPTETLPKMLRPASWTSSSGTITPDPLPLPLTRPYLRKHNGRKSRACRLLPQSI
ncbi:hypothetical protein ID866_2458 [Astraeus odoratus]|nr:hypothetical protein ID866_2458 [Astraeus odoratus]